MQNRKFTAALREARRDKFDKRVYSKGGDARHVNRLIVYLSPVERGALEQLCADEGISKTLAVRALLRMAVEVEEE